MTAIDILAGDFTLEFEDEFVAGGSNRVGTRMIRRGTSPSLTVHTSNAVYSAVAEVTDDFIAMGFKNFMLPVTPNEYTMEDRAFITREATEFIKEGTITADWTIGTLAGEGVVAKIYSGGTNFVSGDIGREVVESVGGDAGTLLDFEVLPDGTLIAWIRPSTIADVFGATSGLLTATSGTGSVNVTIAAVTPGSISYNAVQAIGSVPTATEVYIVQDRQKLTDFEGNFQWWATDTAVNLGIISVLVRTTDPTIAAYAQIAEADLEVFSRRYTALYDNFRLNVGGGGFQALPLASSPDINNTTGYRRNGCTAGVNTFEVGNGIYVGSTYATATVRGVLTAVSGTVGSPILDYYLVGDLTDFNFTDAMKEFDFATQADGDATCTSGVPTFNPGGPTDSAATQGGTVTFAYAPVINVDHDGDGIFEGYSVTVDAQGDVPIAKVYEAMKFHTRRGSDDTFWVVTGMAPGETYRGLEGSFEYDANTTSLVDGEAVFITLPSPKAAFEARLVAQLDSPPGSEPTHITMTDIQTSVVASQPADNDVIEDSTGTDDVTLHSGGTFGIERYTSPKSSPFGTFTGSQIFGARGVVYINPDSADTQAYILTDNLGVLRTPPNTVSFLVSNTRAGDRIYVARDTGVAGVIDKDQFGGIEAPAGAFNDVGDVIIRAAGVLDAEVPPAAVVRIVENTLQQEHRYVYDSINFTDEEFNLRTASSFNGTTTTGTTDTVLEDTGQTFAAQNVEIGMLVHVASLSSTYEVTAVTDEDTLAIVLLYGAGGLADSGETYTINKLIQIYATGDDLYDLLLDVEELVGTDGTPGTESNSFVQSTGFDVVVNVRQGQIILPFSQNSSITSAGGGVTVVRAPDTIATP